MFAIPVLLLALTIGILSTAAIVRREHSLLRFSVLFLAMYLIVYPVSGLVHLLAPEGSVGGFYSVAGSDAESADLASFLVLVGVIVTASVLLLPARQTAGDRTALVPRRGWYWGSTLALCGGLAPLAVYATFMLGAYADTIESGRVYMLSGGLARFSYFSNWIVWVVSLVALWWICRRPDRRPISSALALALALCAISASLAWTGGRSIIVLFSMPLIIVVWPYLKGVRWILVPVGLMLLVITFFQIGESRGLGSDPGTGSIQSILDWQWGKFSMVGFAVDFVENNGILAGETWLSAVWLVPAAILGLIGIGIPVGRTASSYTGEFILGDPGLRYVVSGSLPEAYINFGFLGVITSVFVLAALVRWVDGRIDGAAGPIQMLAYSYVGTLLVLRTLAADSEAIFSYLFLSGLPLVIMAALSMAGPKERSGRLSESTRSSPQDSLADRRLESFSLRRKKL